MAAPRRSTVVFMPWQEVHVRGYAIFIWVGWIFFTSWLVTTKIVPPLLQGEPPEYIDEFSSGLGKRTTGWKLSWGEKSIGETITLSSKSNDHPLEIRSATTIRGLSLGDVLSEVLGGAYFVMRPMMAEETSVEFEAEFATRAFLQWDGSLESFETCVKSTGGADLLLIRGVTLNGRRLTLDVRGADGAPLLPAGGPLTNEFALPTNSQLGDSFSPRSQFRNLRVGQRWTVPVVNPISPGAPVRIIQADVESRVKIHWNETEVEAHKVVFRYDSGLNNPGSAPLGVMHVAIDGRVLLQEAKFSNISLRMERMTDEESAKFAAKLDDRSFDKLLRLRSSLGSTGKRGG